MLKLKVRISYDKESGEWIAVSKNFDGLFLNSKESASDLIDYVKETIPELLGVTRFHLIIDIREDIYVR